MSKLITASPRMTAMINARQGSMIGNLAAYAYANTLTRLIPDLYAGLDVVSRELVGFIPSVARNSTAERAAVGQSVVFFKTPPANVVDIVPAMQVPNPDDQTIGNDTIVMTKSKAAEFGFTGEEQKGLNFGSGYLSVQADMFSQGLRALCNLIEIDLAVAGTLGASRAVGTAGTTPFATGVGDSAQVRKILDDNGAPLTGRSLVISTASGAGLRTNTQLTKANEVGNTMNLMQGSLIDLHGFMIKESGQAQSITKGTAATATTSGAAILPVGTTIIPLAATGTGVVNNGDVVTFAGDTNKYVVATGNANVSAGGTIVLQAPGLRVAQPAAATAITVGNSFTGNVAFSSNALLLATRQPALPQEGDLALDRMTITDPRSGLTFEVAIYPGYRKIRAEVAVTWGVKVTKPEHMALLLG